jgi:hypothetical protein
MRLQSTDLFSRIEKSSQEMGLFDSYFDPDQFQGSGGLLGRLLSLQPLQDQYQPGAGFDLQSAASGRTASAPQTPLSSPIASSTSPSAGQTPLAPPTPDLGQTQNVAIGNYQMPQFGRADGSQAAPLPPDLGDRLTAGFQSWAHTPVGNPFAALANGVTALGSGQRTDPAGIAQQNLQPAAADPANASQDLNTRYQALRPVLGDRNAMLAIVHPELGQSLMAQALAGQRR